MTALRTARTYFRAEEKTSFSLSDLRSPTRPDEAQGPTPAQRAALRGSGQTAADYAADEGGAAEAEQKEPPKEAEKAPEPVAEKKPEPEKAPEPPAKEPEPPKAPEPVAEKKRQLP